ncbi:MAG: amidohydrolase family protein [Acidobacteria bacterium]|nr:amidohydrolase family protein [Acidobacteriota bacterium]
MQPHVDLAVRGARVLSDPSAALRSDAVVLIEGSKVVDVVDAAEGWDAARTIEVDDGFITPGLVNAHTHLGLSFARTLTHRGGQPIYDVFWPLETHLRVEDVEAFSALAAAESLLSGVTTVLDHYIHAERAERVTNALGLRAFLGETVMTAAGPFGAESLDRSLSHVAAKRAPDALGRALVAPHAVDTNDDRTLETMRALSESSHVPLHLHLAQSSRERAVVAERVGCSSVEYARRLGLLERPSVLAHCSYLDPGDVDILASGSGAVIAYCPTVQAMDGMVQPASTIERLGGCVAIGTDSTPNERYSVLHEAAVAVLGQRQAGLDWTPRQSLRAATTALADTLEIDGLGTLRPGSPADLVIWEGAAPHMAIADDPVIAAVMAPPRVHTTIVAGNPVVSDGVLCNASIDEICSVSADAKRSLFERAGLS